MPNKHLTKREREVLELIAYGNSQKEVAYLLDCKLATVDVHVKNIKAKTGLQKATELGAAFLWKKYRLPIIDLPERTRKVIATALLALSIFTAVLNSSDMLRVFRGNGRPGAKTVNARPGGRRGRKEFDFILKVA